jgi:hypothetical protein
MLPSWGAPFEAQGHGGAAPGHELGEWRDVIHAGG